MNDLLSLISYYPIPFLTILFLIIPLIRALRNSSITTRTIKQGGLSIEGINISPPEFYTSMKNLLNAKGIDHITLSLPHLSESSPLMNSRLYMKVERQGIIFYICTFKIGSSQVFTYWLIAPKDIIKRMIMKMPIVGSILKAMFFPDTLYKRDVASAMIGIIEESFRTLTKEQSEGKIQRVITEINPDRFKKLM